MRNPTTILSTIFRTLALIWALPYTLLGLALGLLTLCTGGRMRRTGLVLEFHDGFARWMIDRLSGKRFFVAMTLGFVIIARTVDALNAAREHEMVHVRQYAMWGPFFGPAYFVCWGYLWLRGRDAYRDNPFERQAYAVADCDHIPPSQA